MSELCSRAVVAVEFITFPIRKPSGFFESQGISTRYNELSTDKGMARPRGANQSILELWNEDCEKPVGTEYRKDEKNKVECAGASLNSAGGTEPPSQAAKLARS